MKKLLVSALMLFAASTATFAQHAVGSFTLQPRVGINVANMTNMDENKARVDFVGGLEGEYQVTDIFSLSAGVLYSRQGVKSDVPEIDIAGYKLKGEDVSWKPSYINIPIMANVYVVKGLAVKLGVQPGFMVDKDDAGDAAKTFDFTVPVGLSYEFSQVPIVVDARYNWGTTKVLDGADCRNSVFQFTVGYKFDL